MQAASVLTQTLYLPLTQAAAAAFRDHGELPSTVIERAALYVLALLLNPSPLNASSVEDALRETEQLFAQALEEDVKQFLAHQCTACRKFAGKGIDEALEPMGIAFAKDETMQARAWCGADGRYTPDFQDRCRDTLHDFHLAMALSQMPAPMRDDSGSEDTDEIPDALDNRTKAIMYAPRQSTVLRGTTDQARAASIIAAAPDEHYELLAYAGTGKTHLIHELGSRVSRWVHLAPTKAHQFAFRRRFARSSGASSLIMANLASTMAGNLMAELGHRVARVPQFAHSRYTLSQQAAHAGIKAVGRLAPFEVMRVVHKAIQRWCFSDRQELSTDDVKGVYALAEKQIVVAYAQKVWGMLFMLEQPLQRQVFAFRSYHLVKWLSISGGTIPAMGMLVLDEAHDLSPAWITLLQRYRDGVVLMGDPYQRITGERPGLDHATQIAMSRSVRTGQQVTPEIQRVLDRQGVALIPDPLEGSRDHVTRLRKYDKLSQTPDVGLRVYGSFGQMLGDAQRLTKEGAPFHILGSSFDEFQAWAAHVIDVFNRADKTSESHELRNFKSWQTLSRHLNATGQRAVVSLIERGYSHRNLQALLRAGRTPADGRPSVVTLAKLEHTKSLEEDVVTLAPCCFGSHTGLTDKERIPFIRSIYVAMSRVRAELWVHGDGMDRLEQLGLPAGAQTMPGRGGHSP